MNGLHKQILKTSTTWIAALVLPTLLGCTGGGSITGSSLASIAGSLTVSSTYPTAAGNTWTPITYASRVYIKGLDLSIEGTCTRGVATIKVDEGGSAYPETTTCSDNGTFLYQKSFVSAQEGDKTLNITAYDINGTAMTGATASASVRIDNTAPSAVVVTTPASTPYVYQGNASTFHIVGTCSADTIAINFNSPTGPLITPSGTTWSYDVTLIDGASVNYGFYAQDLAGNVSALTTQAIDYIPTIMVLTSNIGAGGSQADSVSHYKLESSVFTFPGTASIHTASGMKLEAGFNIITNSVRAN